MSDSYNVNVHNIVRATQAAVNSIGAGLDLQLYSLAVLNRLTSDFPGVHTGRDIRIEVQDQGDVVGEEFIDLTHGNIGVVLVDLHRAEVLKLGTIKDPTGPRESYEHLFFRYSSLLRHSEDLAGLVILDLRRPKINWRVWWKDQPTPTISE